jgi:hypothetical protein
MIDDIHDIKTVVGYGYNSDWIKYGLLVFFILMALVLAGFLFKCFKNRKSFIQTIEAQLSPEDEAYRALKDLNKLMDVNSQEYYFQLSAILRIYIKERFDLNAPEMTTEELLPAILKLNIDEDLKVKIKSLINFSDPVKFAGAGADVETMRKHYDFAHDFIGKTSSER